MARIAGDEYAVFCFHDETVECLAEGLTTERYVGSPRAVLSELVGRLLG